MNLKNLKSFDHRIYKLVYSNMATTLEGHAHEFQYLKKEDQSQFANDPEVSPSDILKQLSAIEASTQSMLLTPDTSVTTPQTQNNAAPVTPPSSVREEKKQDDTAPLTPPPAPVKQKDEFQYHYDGDESVEISHLIAQQEEAPPSPIPFIPEEEEGELQEEPFDCMPVDFSDEAILKRLEKVVQDSDRVLHPHAYKGKVAKPEVPEMAMMTPIRSGDPLKSPVSSDCGNSTLTGLTTALTRASVKMVGKIKKPNQPIMKLRVNDHQFEPLHSVYDQTEDIPFDETTTHSFKAALRNVITAVTYSSSPNDGTPDTTLMEDSETDDDTTNDGTDDEWTADTSKDTAEGSSITNDYPHSDAESSLFTNIMDTIPMDEAAGNHKPKSARARRRQKRLERARAMDKESKEAQGWDEKLLDAVFSPGVTDTALEVADFLQSGAEVTISMTKGMLQDAVTQLEQEEREINGEKMVEDTEEEDTDAGEDAYQNIAAAATGSNLQGNDNDDDDANNDHGDATTQTETATTAKNDGDEAKVKDPWDQPEESFGPKKADFADLIQRGVPLLNRKLERMVNEWTKTSEEEEEAGAATTDAPEQQKAEDRVSAETNELVEAPVTDQAYETPAVVAAEEDDDQPVEEGSDAMTKLELEDALQAAAADAEDGSTGSLEKPTKRLSV